MLGVSKHCIAYSQYYRDEQERLHLMIAFLTHFTATTKQQLPFDKARAGQEHLPELQKHFLHKKKNWMEEGNFLDG